MSLNMQKFLGGSPGAVLIKLIFLSLLAGAAMSLFGLSPRSLIDNFVKLFRHTLDMGFEGLGEAGQWLLSGAVVVIPVWLLFRLLRSGR